MIYPKAQQKVYGVPPQHKKVIKAAVINFILLQLLFLGLFCYLFGSLFQQTTHMHNLNVAFIDYDNNGTIGAAVRSAYSTLKGPTFPTLTEHSPAQYPQPVDIVSSVCSIQYWGGLYITANASNRVSAALVSGTEYNTTDIMFFAWNEARYPTVVDSLEEEMQILAEAARVVYSTPQRILTVNHTDQISVQSFVKPWVLSAINIQPTTQGSRLIYNTLVIILILIQEFFYLGYINGLHQQFQLYLSLPVQRVTMIRVLLSVTYTLVGSLCTTGAIWAFRHGWQVNGAQFVLTWMVLWLFAHLNFLVLNIFTIWILPPFVPMALISWIILNVTSILLPFELSPAFYKWGYALPAHSVFQVLVDIWSGGCNPQLDYALPVLFVYELVGLALSVLGVYRRTHYAVLAREAEMRRFSQSQNQPETGAETGTETELSRSETGMALSEIPTVERTASRRNEPCFELLV
ncbi:hypothetical protein ASPZODRAFT_76941 [Penicilliopsis zonata CBS 506.65]|uniref:DUF3533 domain-containing protein n=1 Tax=Penicilliopsis zonata CBS 506.65 TaxID=1073090 RepID=A0A1L9S5F6_9EURO|nr:hypothetical protein ASPZODRAFT_76941 [Penicilliopsis zonata CBS 506.65]OJJ42389.1 hypothetical protein ASPZODRAFT_76941 [Penicilliopsis zonata CBS 506.65]